MNQPNITTVHFVIPERIIVIPQRSGGICSLCSAIRIPSGSPSFMATS
jgi:hypothetical protein